MFPGFQLFAFCEYLEATTGGQDARDEGQMLATFACDPDETRGRLHPEHESAFRSPFQRDRDRIIHSSAFRRLKHKTQVFVEHEGDYYRTRLTHSIEVSQVARTVAGVLGFNEYLTEAVALAHDLGHPPFGHTGEDALNALLAPYGGFDHNAQALKIVTSLERHYAEFDGLNLSWEALEGIAKHNGPVLSGKDGGELPFALADYNAQHDLELGTYASGEAQVAAVADDIAYNNHDIHDGLRAGLFTLDELAELPVLGPAIAEVDARWPGLEEQRRRHEALRRVFGAMVEDVLIRSKQRLQDLNPASVDDIRHAGTPVVRFSGAMWRELKVIREFLFHRMYRAPSVVEMRAQVTKVVEELFPAFLADPARLPDEWQKDVAKAGDETGLARLVGDYIAGMTDRFALETHRKMFGG